MQRLRELITKNAKHICELNKSVNTEFEKRPHSFEHRRACSEFWGNFDELAFPGGWKEGRFKLKNGDPHSIETAIIFLEVDPFFFRSGYMKETILRHLKHVDLSESQKQRLSSCAIKSFSRGGRRETKLYARLVSYFDDYYTTTVANEIIHQNKNPEAVRRANYYIKLTKMRKS